MTGFSKDCVEYEPIVTFNPHKPTATEKLLERRIENLQDRIRELEQGSPEIRLSEVDEGTLRPKPETLTLTAPVLGTTGEGDPPNKEVTSPSPIHQSNVPLTPVNRSEIRIFESVV